MLSMRQIQLFRNNGFSRFRQIIPQRSNKGVRYSANFV